MHFQTFSLLIATQKSETFHKVRHQLLQKVNQRLLFRVMTRSKKTDADGKKRNAVWDKKRSLSARDTSFFLLAPCYFQSLSLLLLVGRYLSKDVLFSVSRPLSLLLVLVSTVYTRRGDGMLSEQALPLTSFSLTYLTEGTRPSHSIQSSPMSIANTKKKINRSLKP